MGMYFVKDWYCQKKGGGDDPTKIYGVNWPVAQNFGVMTRTDDAVGMSDPNPYYASMSDSPSSPFDTISPWKDMRIVEDWFAGTVVEIPKFYYKWTTNGSYIKIQISMTQHDGFLCSPAHADRGDGVGERDYVYIGRYHCASDFRSKTGVAPVGDMTIADFRTNIHNLGSIVWQNDFALFWTVRMLYLVEFAQWNSQAKIGAGGGRNNSSIYNMGYTDNMPYHTGTTQKYRSTYGAGTQYRYIEGLWDNVYDWVDGISIRNGYFAQYGSVYCEKNPSNFNNESGGTFVDNNIHDTGYITNFSAAILPSGFEYARIPNSVNNISAQPYLNDYYMGDGNGNMALSTGGAYYDNDNNRIGLFYMRMNNLTGTPLTNTGSRLMVLPPSRLTA